jgi:uncharacterized protein (DUF362 family)
MSRREFLVRSSKAGLAVLAAGAVGIGFHEKEPPGARKLESDLFKVPDFGLPQLGRRLGIARGSDREKSLEAALGAIGGIGAFVKPGDRVLLKVNAAFASPPAIGATTHPSVVEALVRLCLAAGASSVAVTDNPINDPRSCFALSGIGRAAASAGARVMLPESRAFRPGTLPGARWLRDWPILYEPLTWATKLVGVAPVKDHHRSGASMTMKNWYGLLGGRRNIFHQDIHTIITELAAMVRPSFVVLDGTTAMMTNGPTGGSLSDLKDTNTMIVGTDQVAVDAFGATLLGRSAKDLPYILKAEALGLGTADYEQLRPNRESVR